MIVTILTVLAYSDGTIPVPGPVPGFQQTSVDSKANHQGHVMPANMPAEKPALEESPQDNAEMLPAMATGEPEVPMGEPLPEGNIYEEECEEEVIDTCGNEANYNIQEDCIEDVYEDCDGQVGEWQCEEEEYIECDDAMEPVGDYEEDCEEEIIEDQCAEPMPEMGMPGMEGHEQSAVPQSDEL